MIEASASVWPTSFWTACLTAIVIFISFTYLAQKSSSSSSTDPNKKKNIPRVFYDPAIRAIFTGSLGNLPALHAHHGDFISLTFISEPAILVGGLSNIRAVLNNDNFQADLPKPMVKLLGQGNLQTVHGKEHARDRKILSPIFTPTNLKGYVPRVANLAKNTVKAWETATSNVSSNVSAYTEIRKYVLRVGLELVLGFDVSTNSVSEYDRVSKLFTDLWAGFFTVPIDLPGSNYRKAMKARDELRKTIASNLEKLLVSEDALAAVASSNAAAVSEEKKGEVTGRESSNEDDDESGGGRTALELLMEYKDEEGNPVSREHVMTLLTSLMLGALDTTATSLMLAVRRLALHPDVFEKARAEQADIIAQHGPELTFDTLRHMRYLDGVLKETIRLQTPVQIVFRRAVQECEINGHVIPAGRKILVHVGEAIVNDERWLDTTEKVKSKEIFLPERWLTEEGAKTQGFLPFGGGPRLCPGQQLAWTEMKLLLATLARGYAVELVDPDEKWAIFPLQKPKQGMPIRVTKKIL